ncbi:hypothetical protein T492DRAFT_66434 [Pavlovales sp. CCMP2436]|nr:hypothetical protein T492DRAFT_66434 [Pavlovales sp. CCMP2436]
MRPSSFEFVRVPTNEQVAAAGGEGAPLVTHHSVTATAPLPPALFALLRLERPSAAELEAVLTGLQRRGQPLWAALNEAARAQRRRGHRPRPPRPLRAATTGGAEPAAALRSARAGAPRPPGARPRVGRRQGGGHLSVSGIPACCPPRTASEAAIRSRKSSSQRARSECSGWVYF